MAELGTDGEPCLAIDPLLLARQLSRSRSTCSRGGPAGQFPVALLGILMAVAVHPVDARPVALALEPVELLHVGPVGRYETTPAGKFLHFIQDAALLIIADRDRAGATAFGPAVFQHQGVTAVRPPRPDLERLFPPQAEGRLESQRHARVRISDLGEVAGGQLPGLADVGDVAPVGNAGRRQLSWPAYCLTRKCYSRVVVACSVFQQRFSRRDAQDLSSNPMSLLLGVASRARPTAIDTRVRCDAHGRIAVMVDAKAGKQIACRPF